MSSIVPAKTRIVRPRKVPVEVVEEPAPAPGIDWTALGLAVIGVIPHLLVGTVEIIKATNPEPRKRSSRRR